MANDYNYNEFLKDSSDDAPIGDYKNLEKNFVIKQSDDDMVYQEAYSNREVHIALENVLELAGERLEQFQSPDYNDGDIVNAMDSIKIVKDYFFHSGEAIINNSKIAKDNRG